LPFYRNKQTGGALTRILIVSLLPLLAVGIAYAQGVVAAANEVAALNRLGIEAYDAGRFAEAIDHFQAAYDRAPAEPVLRTNLCNSLQAMADQAARASDFTTAVAYAERAIKVYPENVAPFVQLGSYYLRLDRVSDAIFRLEEAIELKPGELDAHELLGKAYYEDNDLPSARAQWEYVLKMDPKRTGLKELYEKAFREESVEMDFQRKESKHFKLSYPEGLDYRVRGTVLRILETAYRDIGAQLGKVYPPEPVQVVIYAGQQFTEATQLASHVGAVYDGKIRAPITDERGQYLDETELARRLTHEYVHVVIRLVAGGNVPWWVNEGLAEQLSYRMEPQEAQVLAAAYREGRTFGLKQLEGDLLSRLNADQLRIAYRQAHATMSHLWTRYGRTRSQGFLQDIARGIPAEESLKARFNRSYEQLENDIARQYRSES
jgi:cytochrome c-type biogenesis protein CcmH/NrfG